MPAQDTTVKAFVGLPIEHLICDPILAVARGQKQLVSEYLDQLNELAFTKEDNKDGSKNANIINLNMERLTNSSTTGEVATVNQTMQMPLIAIAPVPAFAMKDLSVNFQMEIKQSTANTDTSSKSSTSGASGSVDVKNSWGFGSVHAKGSFNTSGTVSSSKTNTRTSDFSAKYEITATATQMPPTEGMAKFTQTMASMMEPISTSSDAGTAS